jgi:Ser/Thr protein kinase RdoA (MazF antagonist)
VPLTGGRVSQDVVRVGATVRRPPGQNALLVRTLLKQLHERDFDGAPRYLGADERGREIFSFLSGDVPPDLDAAIPDETLAAAARLIRRFHDATGGTPLTADHEVVCHNDLSPCNFVFRTGVPVGIIDFDAAAPGTRFQDVGIALFLWLNLGTDGQPLPEQARRINLFCGAYGTEANEEVIEAIICAVNANVEQFRANHRISDAEWWQAQLDWLKRHRRELVEALRLGLRN